MLSVCSTSSLGMVATTTATQKFDARRLPGVSYPLGFFDPLVITYQSGAVATYGCTHKRSQVTLVSNTPVFHDHPEIETSQQLELFDLSQFQLRYVSRRPPNRKHPPGDATQFLIQGLG